jgi:hypothetical protein
MGSGVCVLVEYGGEETVVAFKNYMFPPRGLVPYHRETVHILKFVFCNKYQSDLGWAAIDFRIQAWHYIVIITKTVHN